MVASILMQKYRTLKSWANNNIFSCIPSHFFRLRPSHQAVVLEMWMDNFGNIRSQCLFSKPSIGVNTNVGKAHVGKLGSTVENVARAKQEMIDGVRPDRIIVLNADDSGTRKLSLRRFQGRVVTFGINQPANVRAHNIRFTREGISGQRHTVFYPGLGDAQRLQCAGRHRYRPIDESTDEIDSAWIALVYAAADSPATPSRHQRPHPDQ